MCVPLECADVITVAEFDQDRRSQRISPRHAPTGHNTLLTPANSCIDQSSRHFRYQLADRFASAWPPAPLSATLTRYADNACRLHFAPVLPLLAADLFVVLFGSPGHVADLTRLCGGCEHHGS
jgi:hypothetical protein